MRDTLCKNYVMHPIHEILGIPDHIGTAAIIPLSWPDRDYGPNRRPPLAQFVMYDRWTGSTAGHHRNTLAWRERLWGSGTM